MRIWFLLCSFVLVGMIGVASSAAAVSVDDFTIADYDVSMRLGRDDEGRSTLHATETITADFAIDSITHGIERVFVKKYDGHKTNFQLLSVTDEEGMDQSYHWEGDALRIGDQDSYAIGRHVYVISYAQRDVTRYYEDVKRDEFYWDAIGVEWRVPIAQARVSLELDDGLVSAHEGEAQCYMGAAGSTTNCSVSQTDDSTYQMSATGLLPGSGVTLAIGFAAETFAEYQMSLFDTILRYWLIVQAVVAPIAAGVLGWVSVRFWRTMSRSSELKPIAPEYIPPKDISVTVASQLVTVPSAIMTAQLLDLAVRHYVKIYEVKEKKLFTPAEYEIEIAKDISKLKPEERELLVDSFGYEPSPGEKLNLKKLRNNIGYMRRTRDNDKKLLELVRGDYALRVESIDMQRWLRRVAVMSLFAGVVTLAMPLLFVAAIAFGLSFAAWRLTDKGLAGKRYLMGLKMYIKVAETERIKMLQSPGAAAKVGQVDGSDQKKLITLYEKVLPYAVLFGQEKQWSNQLGQYYEQASAQPDWYSGRAGFSAAVFANAMSGLSSATASASSSSSSSGGSSGGGSSGGGGGGGGGGGW